MFKVENCFTDELLAAALDMAEEQPTNTYQTLFVVGPNSNGQLALGHRNDIEELTEWTPWTMHNTLIPTPQNVYSAGNFVFTSFVNPNLSALTFRFIREIFDSIPEPIMRMCFKYGTDDRIFGFGQNICGQLGVGCTYDDYKEQPLCSPEGSALRPSA